jgi:hypothetical protein
MVARASNDMAPRHNERHKSTYIPAVIIAKSMSSIETYGNENNHMNIEIRLFRQLNANEMNK